MFSYILTYFKLGTGKGDFFSSFKPLQVDLSNVRGSVLKFYCGGYNVIMKTTTGYYGVGTFTDNSLLFINRRHSPSNWEKCDQPFACDGSKFSIAVGHHITIAYMKKSKSFCFG
jgi:hypothetical protein